MNVVLCLFCAWFAAIAAAFHSATLGGEDDPRRWEPPAVFFGLWMGAYALVYGMYGA